MDALFLRRLGGIEGSFRTLRISRHAASIGKLLEIVRAIPIAAPLPDVARHVVEAVAVCGKRFHRSDSSKSIFAGVLHRKLSLVGICHELPAGLELIAPCIELAAQPAARGVLPLGFRRQPLARPFCISESVGVGDVYDGIVFPALDVALWTFRVPPVRAFDITPPLEVIIQRNRSRRGAEDHRSCDKILRRRVGKSSLVGARSAMVT